jgi:flagellar biosynthesis GTPase FlhF
LDNVQLFSNTSRCRYPAIIHSHRNPANVVYQALSVFVSPFPFHFSDYAAMAKAARKPKQQANQKKRATNSDEAYTNRLARNKEWRAQKRQRDLKQKPCIKKIVKAALQAERAQNDKDRQRATQYMLKARTAEVAMLTLQRENALLNKKLSTMERKMVSTEKQLQDCMWQIRQGSPSMQHTCRFLFSGCRVPVHKATIASAVLPCTLATTRML